MKLKTLAPKYGDVIGSSENGNVVFNDDFQKYLDEIAVLIIETNTTHDSYGKCEVLGAVVTLNNDYRSGTVKPFIDGVLSKDFTETGRNQITMNVDVSAKVVVVEYQA